MIGHLHTCLISYNRVELTLRAIESYLDTVEGSFSLIVVDNGSDNHTVSALTEMQHHHGFRLILLDENAYPGAACNLGWSQMPGKTMFLHRADNDFVYLPGWCQEVQARLMRPSTGQVGLRTDEEELFARQNVGGNNIIRRKLWDQGLRYDERPWNEFPPGYTEDSSFSPAVKEMGYDWVRVQKPCIVPISSEDPDDPYYQETWKIRGIKPPE